MSCGILVLSLARNIYMYMKKNKFRRIYANRESAPENIYSKLPEARNRSVVHGGGGLHGNLIIEEPYPLQASKQARHRHTQCKSSNYSRLKMLRSCKRASQLQRLQGVTSKEEGSRDPSIAMPFHCAALFPAIPHI